MASWREFLSVAGVAATVVAVGAVISIIDPMGLNDAADRHSADVVARVTAPFYGGATVEGRDLATVVEVSDQTLRELDRSWPPEHDFYAGILDTLAPDTPGGPRPAVILLDYILASDLRDAAGHDRFVATLRRVTKAEAWEADPACRATPMAKIGCIVKAGGAPVILGKPYPPDLCGPGMYEDIAFDLIRLDQAAIVAPLGWPGAPDAIVPVLTRASYDAAIRARYRGGPDEALGEAIIARCKSLNPAMAGGRPRELPSPDSAGHPLTWWGTGAYDLAPGAAMFAAVCARSKTPPGACPDLSEDRLWRGPSPVVPTWGSRPNPAFLALRARLYTDAARRDAPCRAETRSLWRLLRLGWAQASSAIGQGVAAVQVPCPYHPTFDYAVLKQELEAGGERAAAVRPYVDGRAVAVGAALVAGNDWVETVVNGREPGVHFHAMTFDNLVEQGRGMLRLPPPVWRTGPLGFLNLDWGEVLAFTCAFLVAMTVELTRRRLARRTGPDGQALTAALGVFAIAGLILLAATAITYSLHWKPVNVIGLFVLTFMDAAASFWSVEGLAWVVGVGWGGSRNQGRKLVQMTGRGLFLLWDRLGILARWLRRRRQPRPSGADRGDPATPEEASRDE